MAVKGMTFPNIARCPWRTWAYVPATVLTTASLAKIVYAPEILSSDGMLSDPARLYPVIGAEFTIGLLIVLLPSTCSRRFALMTFAGLSLVSLASIISAQACNCFGPLFDAKILFLIDTCILVFSFLVRPLESIDPSCRNAHSGRILAAVLAGVCLAGVGALPTTARRSANKFGAILADQARGKRWYLLDCFPDGLEPLNTGNWLVVIARNDCSHCQNLLKEHFQDPHRKPRWGSTALFVAGEDTWKYQVHRISLADVIKTGDRLNWQDGEPFLASPAVFRLMDGVVIAAANGSEADELLRHLLQ